MNDTNVQDEQCRVCGAAIGDADWVLEDVYGDGLEAACYHASCA